MDSRVFFDKYRIKGVRSDVAHETGWGLAGVRLEGEEISTGDKVIVEIAPAPSLKESVRARLEAEALAAKQINHINIPRLYDFRFENDQLVYVSEYFDGITVEAWVMEHGPMPPDAALSVALQVVSALGTAAFYKIFHHAINPSNLMIVPGQAAEDGWPTVKILHLLGLATPFSSADMSTARFDNSATFASPEQLEHGTVDFRSEIFSLGCTLWFLLTGAAPFAVPGDAAEVVPTRTAVAVERLNEISKQFRRLLAQMLATNPEERPLDPIALEAKIRECLTNGGQHETISKGIGIAEIPATHAMETSIRRRLPARILALAAMLLIVATIAALTMPGFRAGRIWETFDGNKPIGVPIGIPEPETQPAAGHHESDQANTTDRDVSATNDSANDLSASEAAPAAKENHNEQAETVPSNAAIESSTLPTPTAPPVVASSNQIAATPAPLGSPASPASASPAQRPVPLVASGVAAVPESGEPASPADGSTKVATTTATPPTSESADKTSATSRPEPLPNPPASSEKADDLGGVAATSSTPSSSTNVASSRQRRQVTTSTSSRARAKNRELIQSRRDESGRLRLAPHEPAVERALPRGVVRARFMGTTPDGRWMLELPSHAIVIVPRPPGY